MRYIKRVGGGVTAGLVVRVAGTTQIGPSARRRAGGGARPFSSPRARGRNVCVGRDEPKRLNAEIVVTSQ